jgi:hypothetical protein
MGGWLAAAAALVTVAIAGLLALLAMLLRPDAGASSLLSLANTGPAVGSVAGIPSDQLGAMQAAAAGSGCGLRWSVLPGVARVGSDFGRNMATSSAGAIGYGQFLPGTWAQFGHGGNSYDFHDALPVMAHYLCALGAGANLELALWRYSGCDPSQPGCFRTDTYPSQVLALAQ